MNDPVFASFVLCVPPIVSLSKELVYALFLSFASLFVLLFALRLFFVLELVALIPR